MSDAKNDKLLMKIVLGELGLTRDSPKYMNEYMKARRKIGRITPADKEEIKRTIKRINQILGRT